MSAAADPLAALERSRRLRLAGMAVGLGTLALGWPLALALDDGRGTHDELAGALVWAGLIGAVAVVWLPLGWHRRLRAELIDALIAGRPDLCHIDREREPRELAALLASPVLSLAAFQGSGLVERFEAAAPEHALEGTAGGLPMAFVQLRLLDAQGFAVFRGVLAALRLPEPCPGLTVVARDRGLLGNLVASAGAGIGRVAVEDPAFERRFEAYGTDQVLARTILTPVMLERLVELDRIAKVRGFRCAFRGPWLLLAFPGLSWECATWRILRPLAGWLDRYRALLAELLAAPARIVETLALDRLRTVRVTPTPLPVADYRILADGAHPFSGPLSRLVAGLGMPAIWAASGSLFGGLAAFFAWHLYAHGGVEAVRPFALLLGLGLAYGMAAIAGAALMLWRLARTWRAPLRSVRPG
jgi:hypothetical protein